jgi:hypothetical protein
VPHPTAAPGELYLAKQAALIEGGRNTHAVCKSTDVGDPFLVLHFGRSHGLCWKLEHCRFLAFHHVRQEYDLSIWKFQRIMMSSRLVLVDLPEDGRPMIDSTHFQPK